MDLADGRRVFAKTHPAAPPGFFTTEAAGLGWLGEPGAVAVPEVLAVSDGDDAGHRRSSSSSGSTRGTRPWAPTATWVGALAAVHRARSRALRPTRPTHHREPGLPNEPCADLGRVLRRPSGWRRWPGWPATGGPCPTRAVAGLERLDEARLAEVGGPPEPPARLHGDLWAGNRLVDRDGRSWLVDPAAHGGHREFDLAMMRLFGGFGPAASPPTRRPPPWRRGGRTGWRSTRSRRSWSTPSSSVAGTSEPPPTPSPGTPEPGSCVRRRCGARRGCRRGRACRARGRCPGPRRGRPDPSRPGTDRWPPARRCPRR